MMLMKVQCTECSEVFLFWSYVLFFIFQLFIYLFIHLFKWAKLQEFENPCANICWHVNVLQCKDAL